MLHGENDALMRDLVMDSDGRLVLADIGAAAASQPAHRFNRNSVAQSRPVSDHAPLRAAAVYDSAPVDVAAPDAPSSDADADAITSTSSLDVQSPASDDDVDDEIERSPEARYAHAAFIVMGFALLVPWSAILATIDYWLLVFPGTNIIFHYSVAYQSTNLIGLCLVTFLSSNFSFRARIVPGLLAFVVLLAAMPFVHNYTISVMLCGGIGLIDSFVAGSLFGLASIFPSRYSAALMAGNGVSGLVITVMRMIFKVALPTDAEGTRQSTYIYFAASVVTCVAGALAYLRWLDRTRIMHHYVAKTVAHQRVATSDDDGVVGTSHGTDSVHAESASTAAAAPSLFARLTSHVLPAIRWYAGALAFVLGVTLALFPGVTSRLVSADAALNIATPQNPDGSGWFPILMFFVFDVFDMVGRALPNFAALPLLGDRALFGGTAARVLFVPVFIAAARATGQGAGGVFGSDAASYALMAVFAVTNGYLATALMMRASQQVAAVDKEATGVVMIFALTVGLCVGVWTGNFMADIVP